MTTWSRTTNQRGAPTVETRRAASMAGTIVEWYEFFLYGTAATLVFSKIFSPGTSELTAILSAFITYAVGFFARPGWRRVRVLRRLVRPQEAAPGQPSSSWAAPPSSWDV